MLSSRTKIIILIAGAIVVFLLIIGILFGWFGRKKEEPPVGPAAGEVDLSFLQNKEAPSGKTFDAANREEFGFYQQVGDTGMAAEEKAVLQFARFFVERFGTYSSDAGSAYIDDLLPFMTLSGQERAKTDAQKQGRREGYFAIKTEIAGVDKITLSPDKKTASLSLVTERAETNKGKSESYRQKVDIRLIQNAPKGWLVDEVYWGEKQ